MPDDGDANVFEIISSQLGQNIGSNLILPERLLIALQAQLPQPCQDVHRVPSQAIKSARAKVIRPTMRAPPIRSRPNGRNHRLASKRTSRSHGTAALACTPVIPQATPLRALSALLRRSLFARGPTAVDPLLPLPTSLVRTVNTRNRP